MLTNLEPDVRDRVYCILYPEDYGTEDTSDEKEEDDEEEEDDDDEKEEENDEKEEEEEKEEGDAWMFQWFVRERQQNLTN